MNLRVKLAVSMVALAAGATIVVGAVSYASTDHELRSQVDASLRDAATRYEGRATYDLPGAAPGQRPGLGGDGTIDGGLPRKFTQILVQVLDANGRIIASPRSGDLPVGERDTSIAADLGPTQRVYSDVTLDGEEFRMLTVSTSSGAVQLARSLSETDRVLDRILDRSLMTIVAMSFVALLIGLLIAQQVTRRLVRLTDAATAVATSGDLELQVPVDGRDETGKLGRAFNGMLASLARSKRSQYQLVQDAGHELRTPLTSLRTNVSVMRRFAELSPASQQRLLDDLDSETRELTDLVNELVQLATDRRDEETPMPLVLSEVAQHVVDRAVRRSGRSITLNTHDIDHAGDAGDARDAGDTTVIARPQAVERAMTNLVGNALKFSDGDIEVVVCGGRFEVLDRGPGLAEEDVTRVFDRFYRSVQARALPGSGLGLAIVRDVAESHDGTVLATNRKGGGSRIGFSIPLTARGRPVT